MYAEDNVQEMQAWMMAHKITRVILGNEVTVSGKVTKSIASRLQENIIVTESDCWEYQGYRRGKRQEHCGFYFNGKDSYAHIAAYEVWIGPVGDNCVLHHCDNGICINPAHLFLGDRPDNIADMVSKSRQAVGENHSQARFTEVDIVTIHSLVNLGFGNAEIGRMFDTYPGTIGNIKSGKTWGWLKSDGSSHIKNNLRGGG